MTNPDALWKNKRLGVLGAGNMAEALVRGVTRSGLVEPARVWAVDPSAERREVFRAAGCNASEDPADAAGCDLLLLSVKPQIVREAVSAISALVKPGTLVVSIVAGVGSDTLAGLFREGVRIVRVMPNTPLLVGMGMSAAAAGSGATADDLRMVLALFSAAGTAVEVDEAMMNAVTALSGSGPAYVFLFAEALAAAGVRIGLPADVSLELAAGTLRGAAEMLAQGGDPARLRKNVTSPGGTTAAAVAVFEDGGFRELVLKALLAARDRGEELGKQA